jgi:hypothetical protein
MDEGSDARHGPGGPDGSVPDDSARADSSHGTAPGEGSPQDGPGGDGPRPAPQEPATPVSARPRPAPHEPTAPARAHQGDDTDAGPGRAHERNGPDADPGHVQEGDGPDAGPEGTLPGSAPELHAPPPTGLAALSLPYQIAAALALAVVMVGACAHLALVFLHVAPSNTVTKQHGRAVDDWVYPEFEQNWKLFAPNPLQQNIAVQVRADVRTADGGRNTTGWYDLSAQDGAAIDGNLLPSHTQQNELRRAWDFYVGTHDNQNRPAGMRGDLAERYLRRVVVLRLGRADAGGKGAALERVQVRSRTTNVPPPEWSEEQLSDKPVYRELPWWTVPAAERTGADA